MNLIDRAAVQAGMMKYGFLAPDMTVHEFVEDELPIIPAVPLDPLCEWLARSALFNTGYRNKIGASMWKELIKREVMEGLNGRSD